MQLILLRFAIERLIYHGDGSYAESQLRRFQDDDARRKREERALDSHRDGRQDSQGGKFDKFDHVEKTEFLSRRIERMLGQPNALDIEHLEPAWANFRLSLHDCL